MAGGKFNKKNVAKKRELVLCGSLNRRFAPMRFAQKYGEYLGDAMRTVLLFGPDHPAYWETWQEVEQHVKLIDANEHVYRIWLDENTARAEVIEAERTWEG